MIPRKIKVYNFGAIPAAEIDLTGISLASIVGANGFGKSTLFTWAPLYALFGKTKNGCSVDDMIRTGIRTGENGLFVQFDFEHQGSEYQITRTRSKKGKGKSTLELQQFINGRHESLSGTTIAETDGKIRTLLNLDANTFISSSMILQNDSANFTQKPPGERKAILTQILGLEIYDRLQQAAKEHEKHLTIELETSKNKLADLEEKLQALPEVEKQMLNIGTSITINSLDIREGEGFLLDAQAQIKDLEGKEQQAVDIKKQMDVICTDIKAIDQEIADHDAKVRDAEKTLMDEVDILAKVAELDDIKAQIPALQAKEDRVTQLKADSKKLTDEMIQSKFDRDKLHSKIIALEQDLSCRDELKQASDDYQRGLIDLKALDLKADQWRELERQENTVVNQLDDLCKEIKNLQTTLRYHEKKISILHDSGCIDPENAKCLFLKDARESQLLLPSVQENIEELQKQCEPLMVQSKAFMTEREALSYDSSHHADLKKRVESLRTQAEAYSQLEGKEELLKNLEEQRESIVARLNVLQDSIDKIKLEVDQLQKETENLPILKASIPTLEKYVAMKDKLPEARTTMKLSQEAIEKLQAEIAIKNDQYQHLLTDYAFLSQKFAGELPKSREAAQSIESELKGLQAQLNALYAQQGTYKAKLDALLKDAEEKDKLSAELAPKAKELARWQTLVKAFSKNGIPALIIENSIPELERISNDILSQMSNGSHSLRFETQRDLKSKDGVAETLDIVVSDWAGSRPYETYSGGEQLRIDLAIRFALAELLANRAGSKVEWIVADEIFGSQDSQHRDLVIDAIKSVADRFKLVLVISHITETQAAFDQQIVLGEGGKLEVLFS